MGMSEISFWLAQFENLQISEGAFVLVCSSQTDPVNWDFLNFFLKMPMNIHSNQWTGLFMWQSLRKSQ